MDPSPVRPRTRFDAFVRGYKAVGTMLLTTLLLFLLLNIVCSAFLSIAGRPEDPGGWRMVPDSFLPAVYPDLDPRERSQLFAELSDYKFEFQPFTHFRIRNTTGRYLNVRNGIRSIGEEIVWPPRKEETAVFLFGGSTTFGSRCADYQTIAAHLQEFLRGAGKDIRVYNFGCVFYYSTQERILFEQLLQTGHLPRAAVFIDGLNENAYTDRELAGMEQHEAAFTNKRQWPRPPVVKAVRALAGTDAPPPPAYDFGPEVLQKIIDRYRTNKKLIEATARAFGVEPVFVWQPVPNYKMDANRHPFTDEQMGRYLCAKLMYPRMAEQAARVPLGDNFLWLADLQVGVKEPMYVDQVHYSSMFSKVIAESIFKFLVDRRIVPAPPPK